MAEADAEDRELVGQRAHRLADALHARRIARAVREEERLAAASARISVRRRARRHHRHVEAVLDQQAQDVALDAEVERDDAVARASGAAARGTWPDDAAPAPLAPAVARVAGDLDREIAAVERGRPARAPGERVVVLLRRIGREHALLRSAVADAPHQRARVDAGDARERRGGAGRRRATPARASSTAASNSSFTTKPERKGRRDSSSSRVHADVADLRVGHHHDLTGVGRIGEDLLVAGDAGVEAHLARLHGRRAEGARRGRRCRPRARAAPAAEAGDPSSRSAPRAPRRTPAGLPRASRSRDRSAPRPPTASCATSRSPWPGRSARRARGSITRDVGGRARRPGCRPAARGCAPGSSRGGAPTRAARAVPPRTSSSVTAAAVSKPIMPGGASVKSSSFSCCACGAWSVAIASSVPSASPARQASRSSARAQRRRHLGVGVVAERGLVGERQVVRRHLGGHVDRRARARAGSARRAWRVETCATCRCAPVNSASTRSRATCTTSAMAGLPGRPRRVETGALVQHAACRPGCGPRRGSSRARRPASSTRARGASRRCP